MFNKVKQGQELLKMRSEAKKLQNELAQVTNSQHEGEFSVKVSADQKVVYIKKGDERLEDLEKAINKAFKEVQKDAAKKMMEMGGGLSGLLSGLGQ